MQELEGVEILAVLCKDMPTLGASERVGFDGVQGEGGGVGEGKDQGGEGFGRKAGGVHEEEGAEDDRGMGLLLWEH